MPRAPDRPVSSVVSKWQRSLPPSPDPKVSQLHQSRRPYTQEIGSTISHRYSLYEGGKTPRAKMAMREVDMGAISVRAFDGPLTLMPSESIVERELAPSSHSWGLEHNWSERTHALVRGSEDRGRHSQTLYRDNRNTAEISNQEALHQKRTTDQALRSMAKESRQLQQRLEAAIEDVSAAIAEVDAMVDSYEDAIVQRVHHLEVNCACVETYKSRPAAEAIMDEPMRALQTQQRELSSSKFQLKQMAEQLHSHGKGLRQCHERMQCNASAKEEAANLDLQALRNEDFGDDDTELQESPLDPKQWRVHTSKLLDHAQLLCRKAKHARLRLQPLLAEREEREEGIRLQLVNCMERKVLATQSMIDSLQRAIQIAEADLEDILSNWQNLEDGVAAKDRAIKLAKERLRSRQGRPTSERKRDVAERQLEHEMGVLSRARLELMAQMQELQAHRESMQVALETKRQDVENKEAMLECEERVLEMQETLAISDP